MVGRLFLCVAALVSWASPALGACPASPGDLNGDENISVVDVQCAIVVTLYELAGGVAPTCLSASLSADLDCNGVSSVVDVVLVVVLALGEPLGAAVDANDDACVDACEEGCAPGACPTDIVFARPSPCHLGTPPASPGAVASQLAFPLLSFHQPTHIAHAGDGSDRLFVVERLGHIRVFPNDPAVQAHGLFLDLSAKVSSNTANEMGLFSIAFHPDYASNGYFFLHYTTGVYQSATDPLRSRISRFSISENPNAADPSSELIVLEFNQPGPHHNGGLNHFGPDGMLYIGTGDGGAGGAPAQNMGSLLGKMLRIDVDNPSPGLAYGIPADNPFLSTAGARGEIWALGLRNPWRYTFDPVTGKQWLADVGAAQREEVDVIVKGANYGWPAMEGTLCAQPPVNCNANGQYTLPVAEYDHSMGNSITGGVVYRGTRLPSLYGAYLYVDLGSGLLHALTLDAQGAVVHQQIADLSQTITSFGTDEAGEVFLAHFNQAALPPGRIYTLVEQSPSDPAGTLPLTLSATECFEDFSQQPAGALVPATGVLPYRVNAQLYSDGADKERWAVLPENTAAQYAESGTWALPDGTMLIKHFEIETNAQTQERTRLETRFLLQDAAADGGMAAYTYVWNEAQTEATLLTSGGTRTFDRTDAAGQVSEQTWTFPSQAQCFQCHTDAAGGILGLETAQLNGAQLYNGVSAPVLANQVEAWLALGLLEEAPATTGLAALSDWTDANAGTEARARAFLHANCAHCHQPGANLTTDFDVRWHTPLSDTELCEVAPVKGDLGVPGALLLAPGAPELSVVFLRAAAIGTLSAMPPLAVSVANDAAISLLDEWISSMDGCPQ